MWYGILIAMGGCLGGLVAAMYYRYKSAEQRAEIVGLRADVVLLNGKIETRNAALEADTIMISKLKREYLEHVDRLNAQLENRDADLNRARAALRAYRVANPDAVIAGFAELFAAPQANGNEDGDGGPNR